MTRESDTEALKGGIRAVFESGVPQQLIQIAGNLAVSLVQAGAQNPLYAGMVGVAGANVGRKIGVFSDLEADAIKLSSAGFVVLKVASEAGGLASKTVSYANTYDIPDVQVPRLPPRPPLVLEAVPQLPEFPTRPGLPSPAPTPFPKVVEEPVVVPVKPIELPEPLVPPTVPFRDPTGTPITVREVEFATAAGIGGAAAAGAAAAGRPAFGGFGVTGIGVRRDVPTPSPPQ